ncbi:hypothetical protein [Roseisolibacter sp. H3M3-2]|uniref:hypothetical protein n=1 Tax=Roseisolibacter sp. H3M3-2 TaxID=3031323 RepID=UPI0023DC4DE5|nr:hypothetical protein [Roseisolibacter sp. H3M3-2]MDF1505221.1 hypothetical protein [Roseisolibacter sp. H3M3-2]
MSASRGRSTRARRPEFDDYHMPPEPAASAREAVEAPPDVDAAAYAAYAAAVAADASGDPQAASRPVVPQLPPILYNASGLYEFTQAPVVPTPAPAPAPPVGRVEEEDAAMAEPPEAALVILRETLRLDVDGRYPQMTVSGTIFQLLTERIHWIARLTRQADGSWTGPIWYKSGTASALPYTQVKVTAVRSPFPTSRSVTVVFSGGGSAVRTRKYKWASAYFRPCELEYDTVAGATAVTGIQTHAHPRRPSSLASESLTIEKVFQRAGFNVTRSGDSPIPIVNAGADQKWNDAEMHDAMQRFWSRFADRPQWAVWTLFASLSAEGTSLGGVMFDDIGPNHRQGTAVFSNSFIAQAPAGDAAPAAWVARMRFWTAVHELGHTFNLAHSWQKVHPPEWGNSWVPLANDPQARSFMNYPYNVTGGQSAFFGSFEYRFSDAELLFMRHAPERFVQHGNASWFADHGFEQVRKSDTPALTLELRSNQADQPKSHAATHQFLDQVVVELKVTNATDEPQLVDEHLLETSDAFTIAIRREGGQAKVFSPHATACWHARKRVLTPGESMYASLYLSAGRAGFYVSEPGRYVVQAALHLADEDVVSNPLALRVLPPRGYEEEAFAQDLFLPDVGRALAFDGTRALVTANAVLQEAVERFPKHPVATHARVALALPRAQTFRELRATDDAPGEARLEFRGLDPAYEEATGLLHDALAAKPAEAARVLGHIDFADYGARYAQALEEGGDGKAAEQTRETVIEGLKKRGVRAGILAEVKQELKAE